MISGDSAPTFAQILTCFAVGLFLSLLWKISHRGTHGVTTLSDGSDSKDGKDSKIPHGYLPYLPYLPYFSAIVSRWVVADIDTAVVVAFAVLKGDTVFLKLRPMLFHHLFHDVGMDFNSRVAFELFHEFSVAA